MEQKQWNLVLVSTNLLSSNPHWNIKFVISHHQNRVFKLNLRRFWLFSIIFCLRTQTYLSDFVDVTKIWWVNNTDEHFSNHFLNRYILVLLSYGVMYQYWMCFFYLRVLLSYAAVIFSLYIELLQYDLVRWTSLNNSLQHQALNYFHILNSI